MKTAQWKPSFSMRTDRHDEAILRTLLTRLQCHNSTLLHFLFHQYNPNFFSCLIHLTATSISISFSCIFFSVTLTFLPASHVFPFFIFRFFSFHTRVVHSLPTFFLLEAMFSQFFFQLNKKYVPESFYCSVDQPAT